MLIKVLYRLILAGILCFGGSLSVRAEMFYFDVVGFKSDSIKQGRIDLYTMVPYQRLSFMKSGSVFGAKYELSFTVRDESGNIKDSRFLSRNITAKDYFASQGGSGDFDETQTLFYLAQGNYTIDAELTDKFSKNTYKRTRKITIIDFDKYPISLSGLMLVSAIEQQSDKFILTPHVSDNVGDLADGFFVFFESYNQYAERNVKITFQLLDEKHDVLHSDPPKETVLLPGSEQRFMNIRIPGDIKQGKYLLRVILLKESAGNEYSEEDFLAVTERTVSYFKIIGGYVMEDIDKAIRQLRYIADSEEMDYIESATTFEDKHRRFDDFWREKDPSPKTDKNEAFQQYYARIAFANKNFSSYNEGWLTDKGMVYIIYGQPYNVQQTAASSDGRKFEQWTYSNNKTYIFVDNTGFGDYRLYSPMAIADRYEYTE